MPNPDVAAILEAFADVPALVAVVRGPEHVYEFVNERYRKALGVTDPIGKPIGTLVESELGLEIRRRVAEVHRTGAAWANPEFHLRTDRGAGLVDDQWFSVNFRPIRDRRGDVEGVLIHAFDVTDHVRARAALADSEARLRRLFDSDMLGIAYWDQSGSITDANDEFLRIIGYTRDDLRQGKIDWRAMTPPEYVAVERRALDEIAERGICTPFEKEYLRKDGSRVPIFIGGGVFAAGATAGATFALDLTERRRSEQGRRRIEALLRTVIAHAPLMLFAIERDGTVTLSEGRELVNIPEGVRSPIGANVLEHFKTQPKIIASLRRAIAGEEFTSEYSTGSTFYETHYHPFRDVRGELVGTVGVSLNVTLRKQAEEARERTQAQALQVQKLESLGVLAGGIAHDFNNLLTGILGNASLALASARDHKVRESLDDIVSIAQRAADLTRQMLAYSGKARIEIRSVDLSVHVREIARLLESSIPKKVRLTLDLADALPAIEVDVAQVQQIVMNLVINGAEAIESCGAVRVTTTVREVSEAEARGVLSPTELTAGRYVVLSVKDTGAGMDEATKAKIFDPFFTTKFAGRGLGLAAVVGIVRGHHGAIRIESTPSAGTTFEVFFPISDRAVSSRESKRPEAFRGAGTVLVVDDERPLRVTAARILEHYGFRTLQASNGREALEVFRAHSGEIEAVLLDMTMPELGGEETFNELRKEYPDVRVVLSSGYDELEATGRFTSRGLAGFLQKPYTADELATRIRQAIEGARPSYP